MSKREVSLWIILSIALFFAGWFVGSHHSPISSPSTTTTTTFVDTIKIVTPQKTDSKEIGSLTIKVPSTSVSSTQAVKLPYIRAETDSSNVYSEAQEVTPNDSVTVSLPIEQSIYESTDYKAYVSGVYAKLDSIMVYPTREVVTIKHPPKHWHIGITAGYGFTPQGFQPYIGVAVTYSIISM